MILASFCRFLSVRLSAISKLFGEDRPVLFTGDFKLTNTFLLALLLLPGSLSGSLPSLSKTRGERFFFSSGLEVSGDFDSIKAFSAFGGFLYRNYSGSVEGRVGCGETSGAEMVSGTFTSS